MHTSNLIALILLSIGLPWLTYLGFRRGGVIWGLLILFFSLIAGLAFCVVKKAGWVPWLLIAAACVIAFSNPANRVSHFR
ncbi:MAG: hypothetical protein ACK4S4_13060 [Pyrinomonadaceae bacterium]